MRKRIEIKGVRERSSHMSEIRMYKTSCSDTQHFAVSNIQNILRTVLRTSRNQDGSWGEGIQQTHLN